MKFLQAFFILNTFQFYWILQVNSSGEYETLQTYQLDNKNQIVLTFPSKTTKNPFRIIAFSQNAKVDTPVLVVVMQEKHVTSWQLPLLVDSSKKTMEYLNTSRIMCHDHMAEIVIDPGFSIGGIKISQSFIISLSTASRVPVDISIKVSEETQFYVKKNTNYSVAVSPSEPSYVFYQFDAAIANDTTIIEIHSEDDICLTVSVQDSKCPVMDLNKDITYEGRYQTVNRKGAIIIRNKEFHSGFFLVFVAKADNFDCSQENSYLPVPRSTSISTVNRTSIISFKILESISKKDYQFATMMTLIALSVFAIVSIAMTCLFARFGSMSKCKKDDLNLVREIEEIDHTLPPSKAEIDYILKQDTLPVKELAKYPSRNKRRSFNYLWHILSIAVFYSIPVIQLVVTYQRVVNQTGDQDLCYYNFQCAHPAFGLSDFNHIFSNIGYVVIGIIFILVVLHRQRNIPFRFEIGIPVHYGLFYAMGVALIIEGILSACYHICPTQSNYQFDTSFMYIMAVLCMVKLYQNRHPDINATAYATFTVLGVAIFLAVIGIMNGTLGIWIFFIVVYSFLCFYISFKIYFLSYIFEGLKNIQHEVKEMGPKALTPSKKARFILLVVANVINISMLITGIFLYYSGSTDFGTFLLGLLMANAVLHTIFYTVMKIIHGERICVEAICYGLLMLASWIAATIFFLDAATLWTVTAAESRQYNQECILMSFYDKHDVWHLLSAPALYFSFMFLLSLDDDIINKKQDEIPIF